MPSRCDQRFVIPIFESGARRRAVHAERRGATQPTDGSRGTSVYVMGPADAAESNAVGIAAHGRTPSKGCAPPNASYMEPGRDRVAQRPPYGQVLPVLVSTGQLSRPRRVFGPTKLGAGVLATFGTPVP